jgi:hypothetical protein
MSKRALKTRVIRSISRGYIRAHITQSESSIGAVLHAFQCISCGAVYRADDFELMGHIHLTVDGIGPTSPLTSQCVYSPDCIDCRSTKLEALKRHPLWDASVLGYWQDKYSGVRRAAKARGIVLAVKPQDIVEKHIEQGGLCALTGLALRLGDEIDRRYWPSLDRIDSSRHYTYDNIQLVLRCVNIMKGDLPPRLFTEVCRKVAEHSQLKCAA